jgi:hypothetical protein
MNGKPTTVAALLEAAAGIDEVSRKTAVTRLATGARQTVIDARVVAAKVTAYFSRYDPTAPPEAANRGAALLGRNVTQVRTILDSILSASDSRERSQLLRQLTKATDELDSALSALFQSDLLRIDDPAPDLETVTSRISQLRQEVAEVSGRLASTGRETEEHYLRLQERQASLEGDLASRAASVDRLLKEIEERYAREQKAREESEQRREIDRERHEKNALEGFEQQTTRRLELAESELSAMRTELEEESQRILERLDATRVEAADILQIVSTSSFAGAFGDEAKEQRNQADMWRVGALSLFVLAGVIAAVALGWVLAGEDPSPTVLGSKAALAVLLTGIGGFVSRQSSHHRDREVQARRLYLQLTAFGPFAEPLGDSRGGDARSDFIKRLFVGDAHAGDGRADVDDPDFLRRVLETVVGVAGGNRRG